MPDELLPAASAFLLAAFLALAAGRPLIGALRRFKVGQAIREDAPERHREKAGTPTMGGLLILLPAAAAGLLFARDTASLALVALVFAFAAIGLADDALIIRRGRNLGLKARHKFALQWLLALGFAFWLVQQQGAVGAEGWLRTGWYAFLIVGFSNAVNLTDGLDGLAGGVTLPAWLLFAALALLAVPAEAGLAVAAAAFAGATLAYLWFNAHPAQVFMGDTGSLALGAGLAGTGVLLGHDWLLLLALAVPVAEAGSVILQVASFKLTGRRIFRMSPLHHHFELLGWPETRVTARFALASALACGAAFWVALATR